jgi:hypothetical protein
MHPLTDAFIQGRAKFKKKEIGLYFDRVKNPRTACHLGAIYYMVYGHTTGDVIELLKDFPELHKMVPMPCDDLSEKEGHISSILIHLNDDHDGRSWSNEKVSEWLDGVLK